MNVNVIHRHLSGIKNSMWQEYTIRELKIENLYLGIEGKIDDGWDLVGLYTEYYSGFMIFVAKLKKYVSL